MNMSFHFPSLTENLILLYLRQLVQVSHAAEKGQHSLYFKNNIDFTSKYQEGCIFRLLRDYAFCVFGAKK